MHNSGERRRENAFACLETVIPGRCEASNPESRDSGFAPSRRPGMTEYADLRVPT